MSLVDEEVIVPTPEFGQLTIMVLEHGKIVPVEADNPGDDTRDRVLIGMKTVNSSGNISIYGDLQLPDEWSIILVHEPEEGGEPFGVVEVSNRDWEVSEDQNLFHIMAICIFLGALLVFYPANNYRNKEEE